MEGLIEGRIVHYVMPSGEHRPAIVVKVWNKTGGTVNLVVFVDGINDVKPDKNAKFAHEYATAIWQRSVPFNENIKHTGTWHWIEKA